MNAAAGIGGIPVKNTHKADKERARPWRVMCIGEDGKTLCPVGDSGSFRTQVDADNWIKEHLEGENTLISMRRGKAFRLQVVKKVVSEM